jgi:hypothetical protein
MGEAKRREERQGQAQRQRPELEDSLRQQLELLNLHSDHYDSGKHVVALPMATEIRVLLHDTGTSHSVCELLGIKSSVLFRDTAQPIDPRNLASNPGLVLMRIAAGVGADWVPPLRMERPGGKRPDLPFSAWWNTPITKDQNGSTWSRKDFVLYLSNKRGGAHVDPIISDEAIEALENDNTLGWTYHDGFLAESTLMSGPILPSVRQIAFEVLETLQSATF